jgi:hypothetical protein
VEPGSVMVDACMPGRHMATPLDDTTTNVRADAAMALFACS